MRSILRTRAPRRLAALALVAAFAPAAGAQTTDLSALTLEEAIARALEKNETILIERLSLDSAEAAITGAEGAYDPVLGVDAGWFRSTSPVNSAFSGAPEGELAPTLEGFDAGAGVRQLLPTGGQVLVSADGARTESDASFDLLSPSYGSGLGVELRQPLLRDRGIDAARLRLRVAAADRDRAAASLEREVIETVAEVERAYWILLAFRRAVEVREEAVRARRGATLRDRDPYRERGLARDRDRSAARRAGAAAGRALGDPRIGRPGREQPEAPDPVGRRRRSLAGAGGAGRAGRGDAGRGRSRRGDRRSAGAARRAGRRRGGDRAAARRDRLRPRRGQAGARRGGLLRPLRSRRLAQSAQRADPGLPGRRAGRSRGRLRRLARAARRRRLRRGADRLRVSNCRSATARRGRRRRSPRASSGRPRPTSRSCARRCAPRCSTPPRRSRPRTAHRGGARRPRGGRGPARRRARALRGRACRPTSWC